MEYNEFLLKKRRVFHPSGPACFEPHKILYPFQRAITKWAIRKGRAAVFADCGLGKTLIQLEWARQMGRRVLIVAPLCVAEQTVEEGKKVDLEVTQIARPRSGQGIFITNYEKLQHFIGEEYEAIVLDESSILKSLDGKTRTMLLRRFTHIPYRLCCTATPSPNDIAEMGNHAEFLGVMRDSEMKACFFVHDDQHWRLKGHAVQKFYEWLASWCVYVRKPSDLGFEDDGFLLPKLSVQDCIVPTDYKPEGLLFALPQNGISGRLEARRATIKERCRTAANLILGGYDDCFRQKGIQSQVLPGEQGAAFGGESQAQSQKSGEIHGCTQGEVCRKPRAAQGKGAGIQKEQPGGEDVCGGQEIRVDGLSISHPQVNARRFLCNMSQAARDGQSVHRPRPCNADGSRSSVLGMQPCSWENGGRSATAQEGSGIPGSSLVDENAGTQWLVWCGLNAEESEMNILLRDSCVVVNGSDSEDEKRRKARLWLAGEVQTMVTKPSVFGFGMNFQHCHRVLFMGLGDSWETYYQAIRRCWRFGQKNPVDVQIVISQAEQAVAQNIRRKESQHNKIAREVIAKMGDIEKKEIAGAAPGIDREEPEAEEDILGRWRMLRGDCVEQLSRLEDATVGLTVFSPPFAQLYTYTDSDRDMGNSRDYEEFFEHFNFVIPELLRVTMPGRRCCVHVQQVATKKAYDGVIGWYDFRADVVRSYVEHGWVYDGEIVIDKDPQAQAIRTKSKALLFAQLRKDSSWSRPAMGDYILLFRAPGDNPEPIIPDVDNETWIRWARPVWYGIRENDTLHVAEAREEKDERHICPLQLETIRRCIRLWSNEEDLVCDPFAGIGSTGYEALKLGRKFAGIELKHSYWNVAIKNLKAACQPTLFDKAGVAV